MQSLSLHQSRSASSGILSYWKNDRALYNEDRKRIRRGIAFVFVGTNATFWIHRTAPSNCESIPASFVDQGTACRPRLQSSGRDWRASSSHHSNPSRRQSPRSAVRSTKRWCHRTAKRRCNCSRLCVCTKFGGPPTPKNSARADARSRTNADTDLVHRDPTELNCWFHSRTEPAIVDTFDTSF
jgi:hypothetical protein